MLVVVQYQDDSYDMVIHYRLNDLLNSGKIRGFSSSEGWVKVDRPITNRLYDIIGKD